MIGAIIGAGIGLAGSILGRKQQNDDQREVMELQAKLNREQASYNQKLAKDMWNYTSFPNQVKNMKAAGLNPALLYGMGGQGGSTAGSGQASGVGLSDAKGMQTSIAIQGMGLNLANLASQIKLNESQAEKNEAEANKISGVDTKAQEATIENLIVQTSNEKVKRGLILAEGRLKDAQEELTRAGVDFSKSKTDETRWNIKTLQKGLDQMEETINGMQLDNELKRRTIENKVKESQLILQNLLSDILLKGSQKHVNEEEAKAIPIRIQQGWNALMKEGEKIEISRKQTQAYADDVVNRLNLGEKGYDIEEQKLIKDVVLGILDTMVKAGNTVAAAKGIK